MKIDHAELLPHLKKLRLIYLVEHLDDFLTSHHKNSSPFAILKSLTEAEIDFRKKRSLERLLRASKVTRLKPMSDFDWNWPRKIDRPLIENLLRLNFIEEKSNVIIIGAEGVGKSMIAKNLAHLAAANGKSSLFTSASAVTSDLAMAQGAGVLQSRLKRYIKLDLLVIDELGYLSFDSKGADLLFEVISKRHEERSTIITTNLAFNQWNTIFPGATCIRALIDRVTHRAEITTIDADSYRLKESKQFQQRKKHDLKN
jgi:DNA replication protein DnaC